MGKAYSIRNDNVDKVDEDILRKIVKIFLILRRVIDIKLTEIYISDEDKLGLEKIFNYRDIKAAEKELNKYFDNFSFDCTDYQMAISWFNMGDYDGE